MNKKIELISDYYSLIATSIVLIVTSYLDIKNREVDLKVWVILSPFIIVYYILFYQDINLILLSINVGLVLAILSPLYFLGMLGGADLILGLFMSLLNPTLISLNGEVFLPTLFSLLYGSISMLFLYVFNLVSNKGKKGSLAVKVIARKMKIRDFLNSRFYFPLEIIERDGTRKFRKTFMVEEDDKEWRDKYQELVKEGVISEEEEIWVTWGIPMIPFFFLGYILTIIIGIPFIKH